MHQKVKATRNSYVSDVLDNAIEENPKRSWSYVKQLNQEDLGVADLKIGEKIISDGNCKAEILNKQFSSVFTNEDLSNIPNVGEDTKPSMGPLKITTAGVIKQLTVSLKSNKASGPDEIPPWFL